MSRSGIAHLLKREGMVCLEDVIPKAEGETLVAKKTFKDYEPGFVNVDDLSDEGIEDAIYDSQAIRAFVGIDPSRESAPDATTFSSFVTCSRRTN